MANRKTGECALNPHQDPLAANAVIDAGNIVCLDAAGNAVPATAVAGLVARGVAQEAVDNTGGIAGDKSITSRSGVFLFANKAGDLVTRAEIGAYCYISTGSEVRKTATGSSVAGIVKDLIGTEVAVLIDAAPNP